MTALRLDDFRQYSDLLRSREGKAVTVRFIEPRDAEELQNYYRGLSAQSRYNRFFGAVSELPEPVLNHFTHIGDDDSFTVVATMMIGRFEKIVGEARYAFQTETDSVEFGLSVDDRWQGHGVGSALLTNLACRAAAFGASSLFGDTLRSNHVMIGLARKSGFAFGRHPDDWKLVRFAKQIDVKLKDIKFMDIPCASLRLAARQFAAASAS